MIYSKANMCGMEMQLNKFKITSCGQHCEERKELRAILRTAKGVTDNIANSERSYGQYCEQRKELWTILRTAKGVTDNSGCYAFYLYFSQKQLPREMESRLVIVVCAGYTFWQLFLWEV